MTKKLTFEDGLLLAKANGGECILNGITYKGNWRWRCSYGHEWISSYSSIKLGCWCPYCKNNQKTIARLKRLQDYAASRNGECLSLECKNIFQKAQWKCQYGHEWFAIPSNVLHHHKWCPVCANNKKLTLEDLKTVAKNRNAILISDKYINSGLKLKWQCENGHTFLMSANAIQAKGTWCPYCNSWNAEEICRKYFETFFNCKFIKTRPKWLVNNSGKKLELDGLSEIKINGKYIAFEHNGLQHYQNNYLPEMFNVDFEKIQEHDRIKIKLCEENNVCLFIIPHLFKKITLNQLPIEINTQAHNFGLQITAKPIDISDIYILSSKLKKCKEIIENKGGSLISDTYTTVIEKLDVVCKNGHLFKISPAALSRGQWCFDCSSHSFRKLTLKDMFVLAATREGECISQEYYNVNTKLKWRCKFGHEWCAVPCSIKAGSWCPICARK